LLYTGGRLPTFSFFGWLFWDETEALSEAEKDQVLRHEEAHIRQRHSADVLLLEIAGIFLWFNPFVYLLGRETRAVHEYLADREALRTGDTHTYLKLVAGQALHALRIPLIQPFHAPGFRNRIRMIRAGNADRPAAWKATVCLLVVGMLSLLYACGTGELIDPPPPPPPRANDNVFVVVEEMPQFPGGMQGLTEYLSENLRYPVEAREKNVQGTVLVSFVVQADGRVTDATILKGVGAGYNGEARRVVAAMPPWQPGRQGGKAVAVRYSLPLRFGQDGVLIEGSGSNSLIVPPPPPPPADDIVFTAVEEMPEFPGGMEGLTEYLSENLKYPAQAREKNVQGTVLVGFVVQADGTITDATILKGVGAGCDGEARRVVAAMPPWQPGRQGGKAVAVRYSLPLRFVTN
jgi:TonB family protein